MSFSSSSSKSIADDEGADAAEGGKFIGGHVEYGLEGGLVLVVVWSSSPVEVGVVGGLVGGEVA